MPRPVRNHQPKGRQPRQRAGPVTTGKVPGWDQAVRLAGGDTRRLKATRDGIKLDGVLIQNRPRPPLPDR